MQIIKPTERRISASHVAAARGLHSPTQGSLPHSWCPGHRGQTGSQAPYVTCLFKGK